MPNNRKRFSQSEIDIIIKCVKDSPTNLWLAFENASRIIDRSPRVISNKWYNTIRKDYNYIITVGSAKGFSNNVKNDINNTHNLKPFQVIVKHMLELSDNDREKILNFFK